VSSAGFPIGNAMDRNAMTLAQKDVPRGQTFWSSPGWKIGSFSKKQRLDGHRQCLLKVPVLSGKMAIAHSHCTGAFATGTSKCEEWWAVQGSNL